MKRRRFPFGSILLLPLVTLLTGASAQEGQWKESPWFGTYYQNGPAPSWIYRDGFAWSYALEDPSGPSAWMRVPGFGTIWSGEESWPWFYSSRTGNWFYVLPGSSDPTYFFDSSTGRWGVGPTEFLTADSLSQAAEKIVALVGKTQS